MTTALRGRLAGGSAPTWGHRRLAGEKPWHALWAMMVGFFMILVDATIVAVANPSIMEKLDAGYDAVIWVTSAYLLGFAVPLLLAGRLGDRYGPKNLYLLGLAVFTAASLWCGLSDTIGMLIAARVVQGVGAALLTPQTLSTITRIFPAERRGVAMSVWGATAGVATLVGPLAGGVLVDGLGWQWIFFVNVPVGIIGLGLAFWLVPDLPTEKHGFDLLGVLLSGFGMFMIVFALQEGQSHNWAPWIWGTLAGGVGFMAAFIFWQQANRNDPLIPLGIFRDRDFSLSNLGVATIGFVVTAMILPVMFYAQAVCGLSPTRSALLTAPMAVATGVLAPWVGKIVDRSHPRPIIGFGFSVLAIALTWLSVEMTPTTPIWRIVLPLTATGVGMAFIWSPLAATATRNLPPQLAGAGSGVYNATRQVGSVLGSASMAAFMTTRISAEMPPMAANGPSGEGSVTQLPGFLHEPFAAAMSQSLLLPAFIALFGVVAALFLLGFARPARPAATAPDERDDIATSIGMTTSTSTTTTMSSSRCCTMNPSRWSPQPLWRPSNRRLSSNRTTKATPSRWRRATIICSRRPQKPGMTSPSSRGNGGTYPPIGRGTCSTMTDPNPLPPRLRRPQSLWTPPAIHGSPSAACSTSSPMCPRRTPRLSRSGSPTTAFTSTKSNGSSRSAGSMSARSSSRPARRTNRTSSALITRWTSAATLITKARMRPTSNVRPATS